MPDAPTTSETILQLENLTVSFDGFRAVDALSLSIDRNELRVIIGPNGAGKTTLLDMICGKTRPSSGRVLFKGIDLTHLSEHEIVRAGVGRKFQIGAADRHHRRRDAGAGHRLSPAAGPRRHGAGR